MVLDVINGISMRLNEVFGSDTEIYLQDIEQGFSKPCFFLTMLQPSRKPLLGSRQFENIEMDIIYFPEKNGDNPTMIQMSGKLYECLECVTLESGSLVRGSHMSFKIEDSVLHFFVTYTCILYRKNTLDHMETMAVIHRKDG